ncbi:MAG: peptidoglycan-associated lipoprotein Pal [Candidatus Rokubacteria bacterium]|nr:peptidoglycan-associated lipoprotein Pal [Candidatus Rokubacteria bacterium]
MIVSALVLVVALAGCAKRPATTAAVAPAPTGTGATTGPTTMQPSQPTTTTPPAAMQPSTPPTTAAPTTTTPAPGPRPSPREFVSTPNLRDVFFDFDKYDIRPEDAKTLDSNAQWLKSNPNQLVLIEGHCDERGTNEYNLALGERRAKAAMNYLVSQGVQASRITIISYGEERPTCSDKNESCWAKNRRAHFLVKAR